MRSPSEECGRRLLYFSRCCLPSTFASSLLPKGSSGEVRPMLYLAEGRRYLAKSTAKRLCPEYKDLSQSIVALASKLRAQQ